MQRNIIFLIFFLFVISLASACSKSEGDYGDNPYGHYEDDKMIGKVLEVNKGESSIVVDISKWEKRNSKNPWTDEGYSYKATITDETVIMHEDENKVSIGDIKNGQKVLVNPPRGDDFKGHPVEIILLEMSYEEKYARLLSHNDGFNVVVMYEDGKKLPKEMQESFYKNVLEILEGTEHRVNASWMRYDEDYVVDFKEVLDIEQFPVLLVYDEEELLFKTYRVDELYKFFKDWGS
ncbi:hypothetical protein E3U55_12500 [Filobacillus milosensis]|uniref:DUF3221 domain-containing protein n=1 Tax=Filobacillus milosensis TaxID=94137 RepID=A0A4Y8IHA3_9BACI|nr:hypothetical protein [Filobacillus milosensis]TFB15066.1 hypothetical protein E3U55_12500 [Filobacillus milosensis]